MGRGYPVVIGLYNSRGSWLRQWVSESYYGSRLNRRIFRKIGTRIVMGINNPGSLLGYVVQDVQMGLKRWLVMS